MWSPTHVQVTVQKARGLIPKGKNGTNNAFITIALGKEKFQTSVKEKATDTIEWHERCELVIPKHGNRAEIVLTALHHNFLGADEFLGCIRLPLAEMDVYERPKNRWFKLRSKTGKEKNNKERGELEVKIAFTVKAGSLSDLSQKSKHKSSLGQLSQAAQSFGGSLISITSLGKDKGLKILAGKIGGKITKPFHRKDAKAGDNQQVYTPELSRQVVGDADPGVISDDDFTLDELSHEGSGCSLDVSATVVDHNRPTVSVDSVSISEVSSSPMTPRSVKLDKFDWKSESDLKKPLKMVKDSGVMDSMKRRLSVLSSTSLSSTKEVSEDDEIKDVKKQDLHTDQDKGSGFKGSLERIIIGKEITRASSPVSRLSQDVIKQYEGKSREDLIDIIVTLQNKLTVQQRRQRDLEDYLDNLLLRVMETSPRLLQNPYISFKSHT